MTNDVLDDLSDKAYLRGQREAWVEMLKLCLRNLGYESTDRIDWIVEREAIIASLRSLCSAVGDNDWSEDLYLADVIDKHLAPHIDTGEATKR
jgi:hypothetical protein